MYLKTLTIADIATGNGLEIDSNYWIGIIQKERTRNLEWPKQGNPSVKDWSTWRRVLRVSLGTEIHRQLSISLGEWYETEAKKELTKWKWFWDNTNKTLFEKIIGGWRRYEILQRNGCRTRQAQEHFVNYTMIGPTIDIPLQRTSVHTTISL